MTILLVEDDRILVEILQEGLAQEGFSLDCVLNLKDAKDYIDIKSYDIIILDKKLPDGDGALFCLKLREDQYNIPILILSSCDECDDIVGGLNNGADDYLTKPFRFVELVARIRALSKRSNNIKSHILKVKDLKINIMSREVKKGNKTVELRNNEFNLLLLLVKRKNNVVTKTEILDYIWNLDKVIDPNILNVTIYNLRKKIETLNNDKIIKTIRGIGYKISE